MLGLADPWVALAYLLCVLSSILCIVYGALNWHRGDHLPDARDRRWAKEEDKLEEDL